jgi:hypothetical protein
MRTACGRRGSILWAVGLTLVLPFGGSAPALAAGGTLVVTPTVARQGQMLDAMWFGTSAPTSQVRLRLYGADGRARNWADDYEGAAGGNEPFVLPGNLTPGRYELRLFARSGGALLAISNPFVVEAGIPSLTASPVSRPPGGMISAAWVGINLPSPGDWIGLYRAGAGDARAIVWEATDGGVFGTVPLSLPPDLAPGYYELRLFGSGGRSLLAVSNYFLVTPDVATLTVSPVFVRAGGSLEASWNDTAAPTSRVRLRLHGADRRARNVIVNLEGAMSGTARFPLPRNLTPGVYELWLSGREDGRLLAISNRFTVDPSAPD